MKKEIKEMYDNLRSCNPTLTYLKLTPGFELDEAERQEFAEALRSNNTIQRLHLEYLSSHNLIALILDAVRHHQVLDEIILSNCKFHGELLRVVPINLVRLELNGTRMEPSVVESIGQCLSNHPTLCDLRISWTDLGTNGAKIIGDHLFNSSCSLTSLCLDQCNIGDCGAVALSQGLSANHGLRELWLEDNDIGPIGATALARAVEHHPTIREIRLHDRRMGNEGVQAFGRCLAFNCSIVMLNVQGNTIDSDSVMPFAHALASNKTLQHLWLPHNSIRDRSAIAMRDALRTNTTLRRIDGIMSTHNAPRNIREEIYYCLSLNRKGWRKVLLAENVPLALWPFVFGGPLRNLPDAIFLFLQEKPDLFFAVVVERNKPCPWKTFNESLPEKLTQVPFIAGLMNFLTFGKCSSK